MNYLKIIFIVILVITLQACGSQIKQDNYLKVTNGMTIEEVIDILGEPTASSAGDFAGISGTASTWKTESIEISIHFINGKVVSRQLEKR
ncbi:MAG: outer membrane protein assembly factor BamE [Gammaproteobacteria bacterium]|nr:outer membrane protein assembly factor BamE [Gammaproteobacteria bacterium]